MELQRELQDYKNITLKLVEAIGDIELVESLIQKRQEVIDKINLMQYKNEEFKAIACELGLPELEESLKIEMKKEKVNAKNRLDNIRKLKQARSMYNRRESTSVFFNTKSY